MINAPSLKTLAIPTFIQEITSQLHAMAQEGSEASVASSSPAPNWWPEMHTNPPWTAMNHRWQPHSSSAASCEDQDMSTNISATSFTNASNHSGLSMDSSAVDMTGEPTENQLWSQVLFSVGNGGGELHNSHDDAENFLEVLSSKSLATEMFNPACDYLKKLDSSWDQLGNHSTPVTSLEKQMSSYNNGTMLMEPERLTNLSDLVSNWSLATPSTTCNIPHFSTPAMSQIKHEIPNSPFGDRNSGYNLHQDQPSLLRAFGGSAAMESYQVELNNSMIGLSSNKYCKGFSSSDAPWANNARNLSDLISFGGCLNKPAMEFRASAKPSVKGSEVSSDSSKKQGYETSSSTKGSGRGSGTTSEGKKKRSEDSSETVLKKSKHEQSSNAASVKIQPPKVKLGDRITTLQQIVSPFGKTDTASVLLEAINYIRFLQEQVQLLSDPYLKSSANKDHNSWGGLERKDKAEPKLDLRSRGLCLVPVSCTPQVYRENTGPDYWTPTYRGCIYR